MPRVPPRDLAAWREALYRGEQLDAAAARRLLDDVEQLQSELAGARVTFATKAAAALEKRLTDVAAFNQGGCRTCRDAEARAFLAKLKRIAGDDR
jgi:hypothetical protein